MTQSSQNPSPGRSEILRAATDLFAESGFDANSMNAIAVRAGTSKANVFHHFGSKEALYMEVMRDACSRFAPNIDNLGNTSQDFGERMRRFMVDDLTAMAGRPDHAHLILREIMDSGPCRGRALAREVFDDQFSEIVGIVRRGQETGEVAADVPPALVASMMIACNVFLFQSQHVLRYLPGVDFVDDPDRYAALVSRVLFDGLRSAETERGSEGDNE